MRKYIKPLKKYLIQWGIDENIVDYNLDFRHYGNIRGLNNIEDDNVIILLGTPEPNIISFPMQVAAWREGEEPIKTDRINEDKSSSMFGHDYRYKDHRYNVHYRVVQQHRS